MQNKVKGTLISFEGIDGSGKSTQIRLLKEFFNKSKRNAIFTREPGGTVEAELIRNLILNENKKVSFEKKTEILLLLAARYEHFKKLIEPAMLEGRTVICDRFIDSTLAYQCTGSIKLEKFYFKISKMLIKQFEPNLTILLDIPPTQALNRINKRKTNNKYDEKDMYFYSNIRKSYIVLAKNNSRIKKFNALEGKSILANKIIKNILALIN